MTTIVITAILGFGVGLWIKEAMRRKADERQEERRVRQEDDESTRYCLIHWAFGGSNAGNAAPITPPLNRAEVINTLHDREAAIRCLQAVLDNPQTAEKEYRRFITWFDSTGGARELEAAIPMYLLGIWADSKHPARGIDKDTVTLLKENFGLSERDANAAVDRLYELLP